MWINRYRENYIGKKYNKIDLLNQLKYFKDISIKVYNDCKKYNYKFFEISKDK